jgi:hypothetical protein
LFSFHFVGDSQEKIKEKENVVDSAEEVDERSDRPHEGEEKHATVPEKEPKAEEAKPEKSKKDKSKMQNSRAVEKEEKSSNTLNKDIVTEEIGEGEGVQPGDVKALDEPKIAIEEVAEKRESDTDDAKKSKKPKKRMFFPDLHR